MPNPRARTSSTASTGITTTAAIAVAPAYGLMTVNEIRYASVLLGYSASSSPNVCPANVPIYPINTAID